MSKEDESRRRPSAFYDLEKPCCRSLYDVNNIALLDVIGQRFD